jgi:hypothetical protein
MLPEDGKAHGFDKVSEGLDLSSSHLQRYIDSAGLALREAIHKGPRPETKKETLEVSVGVVMPKELEKARVPLPDGSLVFFGDGGFPTYMVPFDSSVAGRYRFKISGKAHQSEEAISFKLAAGRFGRGNSWRDLGIYRRVVRLKSSSGFTRETSFASSLKSAMDFRCGECKTLGSRRSIIRGRVCRYYPLSAKVQSSTNGPGVATNGSSAISKPKPSALQ